MKTTLLIDGDVLAYQSAFIAQTNFQWEEELWTVQSDLAIAKEWIVDRLATFKEKTNADDYILAISDRNNFRRKLFPDYKANRRSKFAPIGLKPIREWLDQEYGTVIYPNLEADDVLAILATERPDRNDERIIVSIDKDFKGVPCKFYDFNRDEMHEINEEEANAYHLMQTIAGDAVDGFKGVPGVGTVRAKRMLDDEGATWATVMKAYEKAGLSEEDALTNAWMAYLIRKGQYNKKKKELTYLWMPEEFTSAKKRNYSHIIHQVTGDLDEDLSRPKAFEPLNI
jgi:DNA polymerase-1